MVEKILAIPDGVGGVLVTWTAKPTDSIGSFLVFRLSSPEYLGAVDVADVDADARYRFYDNEIPSGTHHYIVQARASGVHSTAFAGDFSAASNGVRQHFVVDIGCEVNEPDQDADRLCDRLEMVLGTNATSPDSDGDGLTDEEELRGLRALGAVPSDPTSADTNQDGLDDLASIQANINPTSIEVGEEGLPWTTFAVVAIAAVLLAAAMFTFRRRPRA